MGDLFDLLAADCPAPVVTLTGMVEHAADGEDS